MGKPKITIQRMDMAQGTPTVAGTLSPSMVGGYVDLGDVPLSTTSVRCAFRITVAQDAEWNGATHLRNVLVWAQNHELPADAFLIGFTDDWSLRNSVALSAAPTDPGATPNAPASWNLTRNPSHIVSGYCVMSFQKGAKAYPSAVFGGDGVGGIRIHIQGEHD